MKAALYARFSTDLQNPRSADDQLNACRLFVERQGGEVVLELKDEATSGASIQNRPGVQGLLASAKTGAFNAVICEALDRLSRDLADIATIEKRLKHCGIKLITLSDGEVNKLHIGLRGTMNALFLEDLAQKTRRGQVARLRQGRIAGGKCYGYDVVATVDDRGMRAVNQAEAAVVTRIFGEYAAGRSTTEIAQRLNADRVPSPRGAVWRANTIVGSKKGQSGLLRNELYRGVFVFNRHRYSKDPDTGNRLSRHNDPSSWLRQDMPHLCIISQELWQRVQTRLAEQSHRYTIAMHQHQMTRSPKRLLSGLLKCGVCGGSMHIVTRRRVHCFNHKNGACTNGRTADIIDIEARVLSSVRNRLLAPEKVEAALQAAREELRQQISKEFRERRQLENERQDHQRRIDRLVEWIATRDDVPEDTEAKLRASVSRRAEIDALLKAVPEGKLDLHPSAHLRFRQIVEELEHVLRLPCYEKRPPGEEPYTFRGGEWRPLKEAEERAEIGERTRDLETAMRDAHSAFRSLVEKIEVFPKGPPTDKRGGGLVRLQIHGQLTALLDDQQSIRRGDVVAGIGFEPMTFRL